MAQKPSTPKGTRDFNPEQVAKRNYIFNTIRGAFDKFGFQPIETPSFENSDTLMGKYGDEGDRLIFKILNSGDYLKNISELLLQSFAEYFISVIEKISGGKSSKDELEFFLEKFREERTSNSYLEELTAKKFQGEKFDGLIDKDFFESASTVIKSNEDWFLDLIEKYRKKGDKNFLQISDDERLADMVFQAVGIWYLRYAKNNLHKSISEKALRYDLTVPFARYVVQHQNEIEFPFKRYQIQPVWRADRPQKGRFREFYQCDADVVGSKSLWQEVEFIQLYDTVFSALKLEGVTIKINNRKILSGIAEVIGASDKLIDFTVALDKLDKIGEEKVKEEMLSKGISNEGISKLQPLFSLSGSFESQIESLKDILSSSEEGQKGIEELAFIDKAINELGLSSAKLQLDVTLARGLNYYTGAIFEVSAPEHVKMGSIGGGGRYDDLTGIFGMKNMSGVGISFGLDRIYLVLEELGLFPETVDKNIDVLFINFGDKEALFSLKAIKELRSQGVNAELYPDSAKMKKQMNHANNRNIPFVVIVGNDEMTSNTYALKNMITGEQEKVPLETLVLKTKKS